MKLIIQIPCLNEAETLPATLAALPRRVAGFDVVEWLVVDDGSADDTIGVARRAGVDHVVALRPHRGLAAAFMAGIEACLLRGADVIVNTDADNQYDAAAIPDLVRPILDGRAQMVIGARPIAAIAHFSPAKKLLQRLGSRAVRLASGIAIPDAPSGFRAIHRAAATQLYVFGSYTYTIETLIQAGRNGIPVVSVPVRVNAGQRPSRLVTSTWSYVVRSTATILRLFILYKPLRFFLVLAAIFGIPGLLGLARFLVLWASGDGDGHVQSVVISSALLGIAIVMGVGGILADLSAANRILLEDVRARLVSAAADRRTPPGP